MYDFEKKYESRKDGQTDTNRFINTDKHKIMHKMFNITPKEGEALRSTA